MEIATKEVIRSSFYLADIQDIFEYGEALFGEKAALIFYEDLRSTVRNLETQYLLHPECRHLETKTKIYKNKILGSYSIIYRIKSQQIAVLGSFHGSRSPRIIKQARKIKL